ncbi:MAG: 2-oxoacid ferredoxin oxidoreductase, subunit beta [Candidatus Roizmanbacteria bacterium GW2011_GWA2_36_23]|uniref:2-oxoacid ferredoxin oxidoreductase, subunit beta n=1 Tax=Candidatus Roizmanbacteria bacterium GW2011_GWA2_36_23 TaxID=1618480 RepID=A0A0G0GPZ0_9BACT|nr:MAG: 2-oxoacid ferredoxin oxidoreductase, subunit beta [Candidatus Roizmanbacteria bacterium GW2011_GWA2_36_23]
MSQIKDFSGYAPTWCPGCGDHGIGIAIKSAFVQLGFEPSDVAVVFGIGCSGNMNDVLNAYSIHSLHGRSIPNAIGIKLANHNIPVVVIAGDGDCFGEGGNHFLHACRGNHDITVIVHDNGVYGLTTGQGAPTAQKGYKSKSAPGGTLDLPLNPLTLAISGGATFVAQSFAGDVNHMINMIELAVQHKGFSLVNIMQPCVTFNKINTYQYYLKHVYKLDKEYRCDEIGPAMQKALEMNFEKFPLGIIYKTERASYTDQLPQIKEKTLTNKDRFTDYDILLKDFI